MPEALLKIANKSGAAADLVVEPWGATFPMASGESLAVRFEGPLGASGVEIEIEIDERCVRVTGWGGSKYELVRDVQGITAEFRRRVIVRGSHGFEIAEGWRADPDPAQR